MSTKYINVQRCFNYLLIKGDRFSESFCTASVGVAVDSERVAVERHVASARSRTVHVRHFHKHQRPPPLHLRRVLLRHGYPSIHLFSDLLLSLLRLPPSPSLPTENRVKAGRF